MSVLKKITSLSWASFFSGLSTFVVRLMLMALFVFLLIVVIRGLKEEGYSLQAFQVPKSYSDAGYNGQVIAYELQSRIQALKLEANSARADSVNLNVVIKQDLNMEVMGVGLSASSMIYHLRELLGKKTLTITGDLSDLDNVVQLNLRMTDMAIKPIEYSYSEGGVREVLDKVMDEAAEQLLLQTDPYRLAVVYNSRGLIDQAEAIIRDIIANRPADKKWAYHLWARIKRLQGEKELGYSFYHKAIAEDQNFGLPMIGLAWSLYEDKNYSQALEWFERCIERAPDQLSAFTGAALCHRDFGDVDKADDRFQEFIERDPDNLYGYGNYSSFLMSYKRDTAAAINIWKEGAENIPESGDYYMALGAFHMMNNDTSQAYASLRNALELDPNNLSVLSQIGRIAFNVEKDYPKAIEYLGRALVVADQGQFDDSFKQNITNSMAMASYMIEDFEQALLYARQSISYNEESAFPWSSLAETHLLMGDLAEFYDAIESAIKNGFDMALYYDEHPYSLIKDQRRLKALVAKYESDRELKG